MSKKKYHLHVLICRTLRGDKLPFKILIDGDVFYCKSYHHAVCTLLEILTRDEL